MRIELSEEVNREMYLFSLETNSITPVYILRESKSGETVEDYYGRRYRTNAKKHKVFNSYDFALLARKQNLKEIDEEYDAICKRLKLRRVNQK